MSEDTIPGLHGEKIVLTDSERLQAIHIASSSTMESGDLLKCPLVQQMGLDD